MIIAKIKHYYLSDYRLVIELWNPTTQKESLFSLHTDDLIVSFLCSQVPIGILLDYIEEYPSVLNLTSRPNIPYTEREIVDILKANCNDPTLLYKDLH